MSSNASHLLLVPCDGPPGDLRNFWVIVDINRGHVLTTRFYADGAALSPDGHFIAFFINCRVNGTCDISITSSTMSHTARIYSKEITTITFSPDSTRLLAMARDGQVHMWDLEASHHNHPINITSIFPLDRMIVQRYRHNMVSDGWFYGGNGTRLLWLPHDMRKVLLATSAEDRHLLVQHGACNVAILDMKDYSEVPQVRSWWKGGIRFVDDEWEVSLARCLERLSVTQKLAGVGQKRVHEASLEGVGQSSSPRDEQVKRFRLEL